MYEPQSKKPKRGVTEMELCKLEDVSKSLPCRAISAGWCFDPDNEVIVNNPVWKVENHFGCSTKHWFFDTMLFSQWWATFNVTRIPRIATTQ